MNAALQSLFLFFLGFSVTLSVYSQDTLKIFRFPPTDQFDVIVNARVNVIGGKFRYEYEIRNLQTSKQDIWVVDVPFDNPPTSVYAPEGWLSDVGGKMSTIQWGARRAGYFLRPGQVVSGFRYESEDFPKIRIMYIEGWAEPPELTFKPDSVVGEDVLEASKKVLTIGAARPPEPFLPLAFLDTIISYKHQAFALGWIKNQGIVQSLDAKLENAQAQLRRNNTTAAKKILQAFINEVEALWKQESPPYGGTQITSEAYALLKFNAEYLISKL